MVKLLCFFTLHYFTIHRCCFRYERPLLVWANVAGNLVVLRLFHGLSSNK